MTNKHSCDHPADTSSSKTGFLQVTATATSHEEADELIRCLTEKQLVACAQVQGKRSDTENGNVPTWKCRFKTSEMLYPRVETELKNFFSDNTYSVKALPIVKGSDHFLNWLNQQLSQTEGN